MQALIENNNVVDVVTTPFEVHESLHWMECTDECDNGWVVVDGVLQAPIVVEAIRTYIELRAEAYPSLQDQADMAYWDRKNGTTTLDDALDAIKAEFPKPE
jgi:hypothetical protein